jgi:GNAT superfamily N-acetyltransferase
MTGNDVEQPVAADGPLRGPPLNRNVSRPRPMHVAALQPDDRTSWEALARGYKEFYKTATSDEEFGTAWNRLMQQDGVFGLAAKIDGRLVGIAHFLFHTSIWADKVCYLQDLFTAHEMRGRGVARALIEAVAQVARERGAKRYYWLTQEHNAVARVLYNKVGKYNGFIRYDFSLEQNGG